MPSCGGSESHAGSRNNKLRICKLFTMQGLEDCHELHSDAPMEPWHRALCPVKARLKSSIKFAFIPFKIVSFRTYCGVDWKEILYALREQQLSLTVHINLGVHLWKQDPGWASLMLVPDKAVAEGKSHGLSRLRASSPLEKLDPSAPLVKILRYQDFSYDVRTLPSRPSAKNREYVARRLSASKIDIRFQSHDGALHVFLCLHFVASKHCNHVIQRSSFILVEHLRSSIIISNTQ
jgi:hypothetical protein